MSENQKSKHSKGYKVKYISPTCMNTTFTCTSSQSTLRVTLHVGICGQNYMQIFCHLHTFRIRRTTKFHISHTATPQPRQQQRLHYTWGPTKPCGWRLANAWGAWLGLITALVRFAVITLGEIMAIRTLFSGAVPIFLETVTLPLLPRSTVLITSSLAPSAIIAITSS